MHRDDSGYLQTQACNRRKGVVMPLCKIFSTITGRWLKGSRLRLFLMTIIGVIVLHHRRENALHVRKTHADPVMKCKEGTVYEAPKAGGHAYIGQTGICFNDRALENKANKKNERSHLSIRSGS